MLRGTRRAGDELRFVVVDMSTCRRDAVRPSLKHTRMARFNLSRFRPSGCTRGGIHRITSNRITPRSRRSENRRSTHNTAENQNHHHQNENARHYAPSTCASSVGSIPFSSAFGRVRNTHRCAYVSIVQSSTFRVPARYTSKCEEETIETSKFSCNEECSDRLAGKQE